MPFQDFSTKAAFDAAYSATAEPEGHPGDRQAVIVHYHRYIQYPMAEERATNLINALGWVSPGPALVIAGAGFSWLAEALEVNHGFTRVIGLDTSPYIQSVKDTDESIEIEAEISSVGLDPNSGTGLAIKNKLVVPGARVKASRGVHNNDMGTNSLRNQVKQALGLQGNSIPDIILTESMIENFTDQEFIDEATRIEPFATQRIHFVVTTRPGNIPGMFNWHTLEEWKALKPNDIFVEETTFRVL